MTGRNRFRITYSATHAAITFGFPPRFLSQTSWQQGASPLPPAIEENCGNVIETRQTKWSGLPSFCANRTPTACPAIRKAQPHMIFMSMVSNDLKGITGRWLDEEVAVLAEIAFDWPDVIDPDAV